MVKNQDWRSTKLFASSFLHMVNKRERFREGGFQSSQARIIASVVFAGEQRCETFARSVETRLQKVGKDFAILLRNKRSFEGIGLLEFIIAGWIAVQPIECMTKLMKSGYIKP